ncbi:toxin ParE1/3/4 [Singulisphaera sp. GP187]|uniref:type II toxin-antitoxin system RelE/ParE family toxin n=1 Tax=Singulisphaera sp. GP187 TaxID=1882752 RepID=UPI000925DD02|nr:type II toxin-antitoxin system RelE/ParE family toxin [Singulisphaera sp. GP187]SIO46374.1 toxin ParE1/3/4 [Singulisphaera sp. GP187]
MGSYRLSPLAEQDLEAILAWSHEHFGEQGRLRYEALLVRAILDVAADIRRPGCQSRPELAAGALVYHLLNSRDHVPRAQGRVRKPRHFLLARLTADGCLEIGRVLHDSMDLTQHLPEEYRSQTDH